MTVNTGLGEHTWATIERLRDWLDAKDSATPEQAVLLRLLKVQEEVGEVAQAAMAPLPPTRARAEATRGRTCSTSCAT